MRIVIAAGSSGGHIFPAVATASRLRELDGGNKIFFIGSKKQMDQSILKNEGYEFGSLSSDKKILNDLFASFSILKRFKPDIAVGFGGYVSFPVLAMARLMGIATVIHEQNLVPGTANRFLSKFVDRIEISFGETRSFFLRKGKIRETGNPIRINLVKIKRQEAIKLFDLDEQRFTVLVMGGSQGAHFINDAVLEALKGIDGQKKDYFQIIHLSGIKDFEFVKKTYDALGIKGRVFSFCDRMSEVYSASDLVISRAGATSIAEIAFFALPAILVPYPNVKVHQIENARYLEKRRAAIVIEQDNLSAGYLREVMLKLMADRQRLKTIANNCSRLSVPDAASRLAGEIINVRTA
ncbi:MAG: undecaprenyldiphospho-muramoylpentapeptide beta-N-acetylglucosaminyltransferase [Candidatus Omnitrophica bacterium]|nr:undecaprenyldiphospho-muramoylpentapeptide beta-N-acetylglucosaminyltransferase [Candidatus Omnitrophota bacterium]